MGGGSNWAAENGQKGPKYLLQKIFHRFQDYGRLLVWNGVSWLIKRLFYIQNNFVKPDTSF